MQCTAFLVTLGAVSLIYAGKQVRTNLYNIASAIVLLVWNPLYTLLYTPKHIRRPFKREIEPLFL
jgi:uncharacterized membrane-anchored protein